MGWLRNLFKPKDFYLDAIILLQSQPKEVTSASLERLLSEIGIPAKPTRDLGDLLVSTAEFRFRLFSLPKPYLPGRMSQDELADGVNELHLRRALLEHRACNSVFVSRDTPIEQREQTARIIAKVAVALSDETTLALWESQTGRIIIPTIENMEDLRRGDRRKAFDEPSWDAVSTLNTIDLLEETAEARHRFPEFVAAFRKSSDPSDFIVKVPLSEPDTGHVEHMWIQPVTIEGTQVTGTLLSQPLFNRTFNKGDLISLDSENLTDWACLIDGQPLGAFTEAKVREALLPG